MKNRIHTGIAALVLMTLFLGMETGVSVRAMEGGDTSVVADGILPEEAAENLTEGLRITLSGGKGKKNITDDSIRTYSSFQGGETITLESDSPMGSFYVLWNKIPGQWTYKIGDKAFPGGEKGFLHEYIVLSAPAEKIVLEIPEEGAQITDIYAFSPGVPPGWVQVWEEPCERADLLLFSTHSDDEQLFFAGILPYYCIEREAYVQVVYGTNHWDTATRPHEQLNGLWTVGVRHYPVIAEFPDDARSLGKSSESRETVLERARGVYDEEEWIAFEVEMLRRFQPQVVIGHDMDGEYRHGAHILNTDALLQALPLANDPSYEPESAQAWGLWEVPKTYLHLYEENPLVMDWDTPLESMGGSTPFELSKQGYACHLSQQNTWFTKWMNKDRAADINKYSPCEYGLYRTMVGEDVRKNDFLENITTYGEMERLMAEEEARMEEQRQKEEALRLEEERMREETSRKLAEEERRRLEEVQRATAEYEAAERARKKQLALAGILLTILALTATGIFAFARMRRKRRMGSVELQSGK